MDYGKPKKIFIVDDDAMLTEALQDYLTRKIEHNVRSFHTGEECLKHLFEAPDVIVLDYFLNTVSKDAANGMEILQTIKKKLSKYPCHHALQPGEICSCFAKHTKRG